MSSFVCHPPQAGAALRYPANGMLSLCHPSCHPLCAILLRPVVRYLANDMLPPRGPDVEALKSQGDLRPPRGLYGPWCKV